MRIALIAPPFIQIPPRRYGGTELFLASLAQGLKKLGHEVVVYANGESEIPVEVRWLYAEAQWHIKGEQPYVSFLGRIAPMKATHLAIAVAKRSGIPLKIAGEIQPIFQGYFDREVKPHLDDKFIEYVREADLAAKNR